MAFEQQNHFIEGMKYPLSAAAVRTPPVPCEFKLGDSVTYTNDYGVAFHNSIVTGFSPSIEDERFVYFDHSAWWFPVSPSNLTKTSEPITAGCLQPNVEASK